MKLRRVISGMLAVMSLMTFAGCGNEGGGAFRAESIDDALKTPYEINWYTYGTPQKDVTLIEEEINKYIKDKINATVKLNILETSQYSSQLSSMIQSGEYFDMCFVADWMLKYTESAEMGAFIALDEYFDEYMPKTYELSDKNAIECSKVNGKLYALPVIKESAENYGWIYRKDIADKYGIDMTKIKSFEELEPYLEKIKANEPGIEYPIDWDMDGSPAGGILQQPVITGGEIGLESDASREVIHILSTEKSREAMRLAHRFYKKGLVKEDILTASSELNTRMKSGKTFCHMNKLKPGKAQELYKNADYEFAQAEITNPRKGAKFGTGAMTAVSATSENPARVMRFIELLNTDEYLNNLVIYGIEGKHYEKESDGRVKAFKDSLYSLAGKQWMVANVYLTYPTIQEAADKNKVLKEFDDNATLSSFTGFSFVTENVQAELASCANVDKQYKTQLMLGAIDPDSIYDEYMNEMKKAGMDEIIAEAQKQFDAFLESKK